MEFKYGFEYKDVKYGWKNKKLFRLPYVKNNRSYSLKEIHPIIIGSTFCFNIQRDKLTIGRLKRITVGVNWKVDVIEENICPF